MANDNFELLRSTIRAQLEEARERVHSLEKAYSALDPDAQFRNGKYGRMQTWMAIREYLRAQVSAPVTDIVDELLRENVDLGKYPRRTVKCAIGAVHTRDIFKVEKVGNDEVVSLRKDDKGGSRTKSPAPPKASRR